ncbi:MAG: hypothetical protein HDS81_02040 [Bacteroidales bacterium]|nr:hypothetical protein [Bacteroidales bacterium]
MEILDYQIIYIDNIAGVANIAEFQETENIDQYTHNLLIRAKSQQDRRYKFNENKRTTRDRILGIALNKSIGNFGVELGKDLACSEKDKNVEIKPLKKQIPLGVLIVAYCKDEDGEFVLLLKSDYDKFISEATGKIQSGLSLKNQIFKTCQLTVLRNEHDVEFSEITTSDSNKRQSEYWHKNFLELIPVYSDTENTNKAYEAIKKDILKPLQKVSTSDYYTIKHHTIAYFRQSGSFDIDYYRDHILGTYNPHDPEKVNIDHLKAKVDKIKKSKSFDSVFTKDTTAVKDRIKGSYKLTSELDLKVKSDFPNPENIILPYEENERKGITIISKRGYDFAKNIHEDKI